LSSPSPDHPPRTPLTHGHPHDRRRCPCHHSAWRQVREHNGRPASGDWGGQGGGASRGVDTGASADGASQGRHGWSRLAPSDGLHYHRSGSGRTRFGCGGGAVALEAGVLIRSGDEIPGSRDAPFDAADAAQRRDGPRSHTEWRRRTASSSTPDIIKRSSAKERPRRHNGRCVHDRRPSDHREWARLEGDARRVLLLSQVSAELEMRSAAAVERRVCPGRCAWRSGCAPTRTPWCCCCHATKHVH
jgi:hypothetical protein